MTYEMFALLAVGVLVGMAYLSNKMMEATMKDNAINNFMKKQEVHRRKEVLRIQYEMKKEAGLN